MQVKSRRISRREFLIGGAAAVATTAFSAGGRAAKLAPRFEAGEGVVEITPPVGTMLCGFHYRPPNERRSTGVRQPTFARALVVRAHGKTAAVISLDIATVSAEMAQRVGRAVAKQTAIPADHVRLSATHTHSAPGARFARQWGGLPEEYITAVEAQCVKAVQMAVEDLSEAELSIGSTKTSGANFNRTADEWKTDAEFQGDSTDDDRWLDTTLQVLHFGRGNGRRDLLWYHFSAHPVCRTGRLSGPDWPGLVTTAIEESEKVTPSFLQGHCGDVNPGDGTRWLGDAEETAKKVAAAVRDALTSMRRVDVDRLNVASQEVRLPLDVEMHQQHLELFQQDPASREFVDEGFGKEWFESMSRWDKGRADLSIRISSLQLGDLGIFFHPSELFSYYGLRLRRDSPFTDSILVGYTDGFIGYLADPSSHAERNYAAVIVPKVLDLPPYTPTAAREFTSQATQFLKDSMG